MIKAQVCSCGMFPDRAWTAVHFLLGNVWCNLPGPLSVPSNVEILMTSRVQIWGEGLGLSEHRSEHQSLQERLAADRACAGAALAAHLAPAFFFIFFYSGVREERQWILVDGTPVGCIWAAVSERAYMRVHRCPFRHDHENTASSYCEY